MRARARRGRYARGPEVAGLPAGSGLELERDEDLLEAGPELLKMMGDARAALFRYEVRITYDTPEAAESSRIVEQAKKQMEQLDFEDSEENG